VPRDWGFGMTAGLAMGKSCGIAEEMVAYCQYWQPQAGDAGHLPLFTTGDHSVRTSMHWVSYSSYVFKAASVQGRSHA
jgi:hypothetical protein